MIPDALRVPDPGPMPDELAAERLDGMLAPASSFSRILPILSRLPPEIADVIAEAWSFARSVPPESRATYRPPTMSAIAESVGISRQRLDYIIRRAVRDAAGSRSTPPEAGRPLPPVEVLSRPAKQRGRNQRGSTMRATNARERAKREENG